VFFVFQAFILGFRLSDDLKGAGWSFVDIGE